MLRSLIYLMLEAERDANQLQKANLGALFDQDPEVFKSTPYAERGKASLGGPKYSRRVLDYIRWLPDDLVPHRDRRGYIIWLADGLEELLRSTRPEDVRVLNTLGVVSGQFNPRGAVEQFGQLIDWINADPATEYKHLSIGRAGVAALNWHERLGTNDKLQIRSKPQHVLYSWLDGWKLVKVPASDCSAEGEAMGHCVGGYAQKVNAGETQIYSLRDAHDRPHVTIELQGDLSSPSDVLVRQVKGKQNKTPIAKHGRRVLEFFNSVGIHVPTKRDVQEDLFNMLKDAIATHDGSSNGYPYEWILTLKSVADMDQFFSSLRNIGELYQGSDSRDFSNERKEHIRAEIDTVKEIIRNVQTLEDE